MSSSCRRCGHVWGTPDIKGCTPLRYEGSEVLPIKVGDPGDWGESEGPEYTCPDCGAPYGTQHHLGCDAERCPICEGQLIMCSCTNRMLLVKKEN